MGLGWFPLKQLVRWTARRHGFIDPAAVIARLSGFGQPAEISQPIELLRAGVILHARGLINARVIQHNLDWVWPWWVERQFDPRDRSFIPRAFSITHVNLSHRNWTALGLPGESAYPIVDPRGLLTPLLDGWSLDAWVIGRDGCELIPSREVDCRQSISCEEDLTVRTEFVRGGATLRSEGRVCRTEQGLAVVLDVFATVPPGRYLVISVRPYNPEGVSFIDTIEVSERGRRWIMNGNSSISFDRSPQRITLSRYASGDVYRALDLEPHEAIEAPGPTDAEIDCPVGLASGAALFGGEGDGTCVRVSVPLPEEAKVHRTVDPIAARGVSWREALAERTVFDVGDEHLNRVTRAAMLTLVLLSPADIYPGPFTYRRFWFRDAGLMMQGLLASGITAPVERCIERFELRQDSDGYLRSQEGEWDSNGIALWAIERFCAVTNRQPHERWNPMIRRAAEWIVQKRRANRGEGRHKGLLPAGFSAEHLGPNDFYFWDDFWGIGGLDAAAALLERVGHPALAADFRAESRAFRLDLFRSIGSTCQILGRRIIPASPYRRPDSGAIGSIVCGYPLRLLPVDDPALCGTIEYLLDECCVDDAFFQDMIHSGINPYLSLQLAQILRRMNDRRAHRILVRIGELASPTGQWPEAIHPATGGGCMGDGQHGWAAAEWVAYIRSMFVAEEGETLFLCTGIPIEVLRKGVVLRAESVRSTFGIVTVEIERGDEAVEVRWSAGWHAEPPRVVIRFLGSGAFHGEGKGGVCRIPLSDIGAPLRRAVA